MGTEKASMRAFRTRHCRAISAELSPVTFTCTNQGR